MLRLYTGERRRHPDRRSIGLEHEHALRAESRVRPYYLRPGGAEPCRDLLQRRAARVLGEVAIDSELYAEVKIHVVVPTSRLREEAA